MAKWELVGNGGEEENQEEDGEEKQEDEEEEDGPGIPVRKEGERPAKWAHRQEPSTNVPNVWRPG